MKNLAKSLSLAFAAALVFSACGKSVSIGDPSQPGTQDGGSSTREVPEERVRPPLCGPEQQITQYFTQGDPLYLIFVLNPPVRAVTEVLVDDQSVPFRFDAVEGTLTLERKGAGEPGSVIAVKGCSVSEGKGKSSQDSVLE